MKEKQDKLKKCQGRPRHVWSYWIILMMFSVQFNIFIYTQIIAHDVHFKLELFAFFFTHILNCIKKLKGIKMKKIVGNCDISKT